MSVINTVTVVAVIEDLLLEPILYTTYMYISFILCFTAML